MKDVTVPEGRPRLARSVSRPYRTCGFQWHSPNVETLGYSQKSLRDGKWKPSGIWARRRQNSRAGGPRYTAQKSRL